MTKNLPFVTICLIITVGLMGCPSKSSDEAKSYSISGTVTSSGSAIQGITITLSGASIATATPDTGGNYSFTGLASGTYTITPIKTGCSFNPALNVQTINIANIAGINFIGTLDTAETLNLNIAANPNVDTTNSYTLRKTSMYVDSGTFPNHYMTAHAIAYADINRDGNMDVFLCEVSGTVNRKPVQVLINNGSNIFSDQTLTTITNAEPGAVHARKALTGDYNGDGWPDFIIIAHGYDRPPFPGEYPLLFLSNGNGTLRYVSGFENLVGFHHGGASADIDADGDIDIFITDTIAPFFLINDGNGNFTKDTSRIPSEINITGGTAELIDIDKDGFVDLVVGTTIYWGSSSGTYKASNKTTLPSIEGWDAVVDFAAEDIDSDGFKDLIINRTGSTNFYVGRYIQILRQAASRTFSDESASRITMNTTQGWMYWLRVQDINGDGHVDIFIDDKHGQITMCPMDYNGDGRIDVYASCLGQYAWLNDGNGNFSPFTGTITPSL